MNYNEKFKDQYQRFYGNVRKLGFKNAFDWAKAASELNLLSKNDYAAVESSVYLHDVLESYFASSVTISLDTYNSMCNLVKLSTIFTMKPIYDRNKIPHLQKRKYNSSRSY